MSFRMGGGRGGFGWGMGGFDDGYYDPRRGGGFPDFLGLNAPRYDPYERRDRLIDRRVRPLGRPPVLRSSGGGGRSRDSRPVEDRFDESKGKDGGLEDIASKSMYIQSKKFYVEILKNRKGKFLKLSEVALTGTKTRLVMDMTMASEFHEMLTKFCDFYTKLGPCKSDRDVGADDHELLNDSLHRDARHYYLELKENQRGRFLKVSMSLPTDERSQIIIPAQGIVEVRDCLTDFLNEHGGRETSNSSKSEKPRNSERKTTRTMKVGDCQFFFDVGVNRRGTYLRISEVASNFRASVTVPDEVWTDFIEKVEEAMSQASDHSMSEEEEDSKVEQKEEPEEEPKEDVVVVEDD